MDWLEHMIFWLPNALVNRELKAYYTEIASYQRSKFLILPQQHDSEQERGGGGDTKNNHNHNINEVNDFRCFMMWHFKCMNFHARSHLTLKSL